MYVTTTTTTTAGGTTSASAYEAVVWLTYLPASAVWRGYVDVSHDSKVGFDNNRVGVRLLKI